MHSAQNPPAHFFSIWHAGEQISRGILTGWKNLAGFTPLWPAGHLPHKGGDCIFIDVEDQSQTLKDE
ncbi:hypothetical protein C5748_11440 [Phyllobacterium phragmitis]|uniref:Uncharacterized protein n=1 Tax=Phyllobacterium phragmitis TaxID=2670329 RepID=A0A2S9IS15_9HYPH|nr:hypothetical protein [Phyllobacterium phragmitis]PRD43321.1 hypothetical protein C5748_11440 [Phyllobacterium phragmitis]